ncbi:response regulator [Paenibacillus peoriae]|uniref:response regulator transcription factor n=1 Tax=Paenibacillus peoriae TaxID=59893 RepID=UPI0030D42761
MKLLIADDDDQIRTGIEQGIDWYALEIKNVITASNGIEALQKFTEMLPEIVVTDVRMPGMDGLELLRQIKMINPQTKVIILSGYNDFEYLKAAIQLDAVDYEMKPIRARRLVALIKKVQEDIIREQMTEQEYYKYLESYKSSFRSELLAGSLTDRLIILEGLQQYYGFDATGSLICVSARIDEDWNTNKDATKAAANMLCHLFESNEMDKKGVCLRSDEGSLVFLLKTETPSYLYYQQLVSELMNQLRAWNRELKSLGQTSFSAGISSSGNMSNFIKMYNEANQTLSLRLYEGNSSIHVKDETMGLENESIVGLLENTEFISLLFQGNIVSMVDMVQTEFERLKQDRKYSRKAISTYTRNLLQFLLVTVRNASSEVIECIHKNVAVIEERSEFLTIDDFMRIAVSSFEKMSVRLSKELSPFMARADEFIRKNYTRELTVEMLSAHVGKTPNYFSHRFKREFGVSFKEYVTRLRIAKAKELIIQTNDLLYEISEKVGFSDYIYFAQVFKKFEGCSPAVLRKQPKH